MIEHVSTSTGLKFKLSTEKIVKLSSCQDEMTMKIMWDKIGNVIESSELLPVFCAYASYIAIPYFFRISRIGLICVALIIHIIGMIISFVPSLFKIELVNIILHLYMKVIFLPPIFIIVGGYFSGNLIASIIFIVLDIILNIVLKWTIDGYDNRLPFNDKVAEMIFTKMQNRAT